MVGRERELVVVDRALDALDEGASPLLEVTGEPGIGKSTLLEARADAPAPGARRP